MPIVYGDTSALFKLVGREGESEALRSYVAGADLVSSELVLTELPRALFRTVALNPSLSRARLLRHASELIDVLALRPLDRDLLASAGVLAEPTLRALDAIHVVSAVDVGPVDAFVTYDKRQAAAAQLAGLRVVAPGR